MKKQIEEVKRYFVDKITACEFDEYTIKESPYGWFDFKVTIEGFDFQFSVKPKSESCTRAIGFMGLSIPKGRLENLMELVNNESEKIKIQEIERLKKQLENLQS